MKTGVVKFWNKEKNFGFIIDDETSKEVFCHLSGLIGTIKKGDRVQYKEKAGKKGINAVDVEVIQ